MAFELPALPYEKNALEPHISAETLEYHYGKHHNTYVVNLNNMVPGTEYEGKSLEEIIKTSSGGVFNNAAQIWNHTFYWNSLSPEKTEPSGELLDKINDSFGSVDALIDKLKAEAVGHFASGWAALILKDGKLEVTSYHDADTPVAHEGHAPLLILDVWEHAYYIDYRNLRPAYAEKQLKEADVWHFVALSLDGEGVSRPAQPG